MPTAAVLVLVPLDVAAAVVVSRRVRTAAGPPSANGCAGSSPRSRTLHALVRVRGAGASAAVEVLPEDLPRAILAARGARR